MTNIRSRLSRLEKAAPDRLTRFSEMTDEQLNQCLWAYIQPLCPKYGIEGAPADFPGVEAAERLLGDSFNPILEELTQCG